AIAKSKKIRIKNTYPEVKEMLRLVGLDAERVMNSYPHELSGGMSQRVMIGMALATHPKLLIADEPTSALDVTIQAQILELLDELARKMGNAVMLITHDMGVVAEFCDKVLVMYAGNSVEYASTVRLFEKPLHPYTGGLLQAVPRVGRTDELKAIKGTVPDLVNPPSGCRFHPRCPYAMDICKVERPPFVEIEPDHYVACYLFKGKNEVREDG
ncbi:ABC transporter ATP-binding protein, partial [Mesotoga prima]|uniref:ABC transporter ATP-binding protein n=1 Tax=Mesotoga prima TaxID=1184387 RepID=UPI002FDB2B66